ncbi:MAG: ABC transporter permease subunit [Verrucomicrobia bacterium]|nr:ABC transporter permease subunit [Verrucomicrobiota bacterium]
MFLHQLRNELWKLFGKKRTYIGFGMLLLAQNTFNVIFRFTNAFRFYERTLEGNGYAAQQFLSALSICSIMLIPLAGLLMPLYVALVGGDLVAKEAEDGTLRMILSRPVSRVRLLVVKWLAGFIFTVGLVLVLSVLGLLSARLFFPWGGLFFWNPEFGIFGVFDADAGLKRYVAASIFLVSHAFSIMGLASMFSCFNIKPAAATILALSFLFVDLILQSMPYFREYHNFFITYHLQTWHYLFAQPIPWWRVAQSLSVLAGANVTFLVVGVVAFHARDIKS